jgi:hypothetical protein
MADEVRPSGEELDKARKQAKKEAAATLALEAADWVYATLEVKNEAKEGTKQQRADAFFTSLDSGILLCKLVNKISPSTNCKFNATAKAKSFVARDNVANFVSSCKALGLPAVCLFDPDDLILRKNELLVVNCILRLSRLAVKFGVAAPESVRYEMEIEQLEKEEKEAVDKGEIEDDDETEDSKTESVDSKDTDKSTDNDADTETADGPDSKDTEEEGDDKDDEPEKPAESAKSETKQDQSPMTGSGKKLLTKNAKKKAQKRAWAAKQKAAQQVKPKYVAEKGDEIDEALAAMINSHNWDIHISRAVMKNKKKDRGSKRRAKGEYKVGKDKTKVFMRIVQGELMVRYQADWVSLESFVQELIAKEKK